MHSTSQEQRIQYSCLCNVFIHQGYAYISDTLLHTPAKTHSFGDWIVNVRVSLFGKHVMLNLSLLKVIDDPLKAPTKWKTKKNVLDEEVRGS
jgi:hypothetical protein